MKNFIKIILVKYNKNELNTMETLFVNVNLFLIFFFCIKTVYNLVIILM